MERPSQAARVQKTSSTGQPCLMSNNDKRGVTMACCYLINDVLMMMHCYWPSPKSDELTNNLNTSIRALLTRYRSLWVSGSSVGKREVTETCPALTSLQPAILQGDETRVSHYHPSAMFPLFPACYWERWFWVSRAVTCDWPSGPKCN